MNPPDVLSAHALDDSVAAALEVCKRDGSRRIAIAADGTAGRVNAGLAIAGAYRERIEGVSVVFIGTRHGVEQRMLEMAGEPLELIPGSPMAEEPWHRFARTAFDCSRGALAARGILTRHQTQLVVGVGGVASAGVLLAARSLGLPTVIHESSAVPGPTNRRLGRFAQRICVGHELSRPWFRSTPTVVTGNPVRSELLAANPPGARRPDPRKTRAHILVLSGVAGSAFVNERIPKLLGKVVELGIDLEVRHQCGEFDPEPIRDDYARANVKACVDPFIDAIGHAYQRSDFAISSAGAVTVAELRAAGVPSLLIPNARCGRDLEVNATLSGSWWLREDAWRENAVAMELAATLRDRLKLDRDGRRMRERAPRFVGGRIVAECEALIAATPVQQ